MEIKLHSTQNRRAMASAANLSIKEEVRLIKEELRLIVLAGARRQGAYAIQSISTIIWNSPAAWAVGAEIGVRPGSYPPKNASVLKSWTGRVGENILSDIGHDLIWYCKECGRPSSCSGLSNPE